MYSPLIVDQTLSALKKGGAQFQRRSVSEVIDRSAKLQAKFEKLTGPPQWSAEDADFMRSEYLLAKWDFRYWAERYGYIELDSSVAGRTGVALIPEFWPSQERALAVIGARQEESYREFRKHGYSDGIMLAWHKTRQQFATATIRLMCGHRLTLHRGTRAIAGSLDEKKVEELYKRDHYWLDNLPFYLKPGVRFDVKNTQITFERVQTTITYQQSNQQAGVGTGQQFDFSHMTELSLWDNPWRLEFDLMPAVPKARSTFLCYESTANGRGQFNFWHQLTESIRKREPGFERWVYLFTPHYINRSKNRLIAPDGWEPDANTKEHAELIEKTSADFTGGETVHPTRDQLYWWETEWKKAAKLGTLNMFLTSYPATPEQSFQHSLSSALPLETLEWMRSTTKMAMPYALDLKMGRPPEEIDERLS